MKRYVLLENVRSLLNVGAIFRTADGAWFDRVILAGYTPTPPRKEISKTALWAEEFVEWEYFESVSEAISELKAQGFAIVCLELTDRSVDYRDLAPDFAENVCLVMGNEVEWVSVETLASCDVVVQIPMRWKKGSLNVATTTGIMLYHLTSHLQDWKIANFPTIG